MDTVVFERRQGYWVCRIGFRVLTVFQFCLSSDISTGCSRWFVLSFLKSWFAARRQYADLKAKPGEREALGWRN